ncbi:MAG: hypothetical protein IM542_08490 [Pseudanabaena sp. M165S2SP1A06QC]|nr:hypothetical protein [Pseudanabaena sp. M165S2SP1A06QC]
MSNRLILSKLKVAEVSLREYPRLNLKRWHCHIHCRKWSLVLLSNLDVLTSVGMYLFGRLSQNY